MSQKDVCTLVIEMKSQDGIELFAYTLFNLGEQFHSEYYKSKNEAVDSADIIAKRLSWDIKEVLLRTVSIKTIQEAKSDLKSGDESSHSESSPT